ncbi:MAG: hypothetical protein ABIL76_06025 [candidate division WOR-3 bacterium]
MAFPNIQSYINGVVGNNQVPFGIAPNTVGGDNELTWDYTNKRLGVGTDTPSEKLSVWGGIRIGQSPTTFTSLSEAMNSTQTYANVVSTAGYPSSGILGIGSEIIIYSGKTDTSFTGLIRGAFGTTASSYSAGAQVRNYHLLSVANDNTLPRVVITGEGLMGLGVLRPSRRLSILDSGVGIDRPSANSLGFFTNNLERVRIDASGNVCIGTTVASERLTVVGNAFINGNLNLNNNNIFNSNPVVNINFQTGTSYTLVLTDGGQWVAMNNTSANTVTIPANSNVAFPVGTRITVQKYGAGNTTIQPATGVTLRDPNNRATINTQYDVRNIVKIGTDEWVII